MNLKSFVRDKTYTKAFFYAFNFSSVQKIIMMTKAMAGRFETSANVNFLKYFTCIIFALKKN